MLLFPKKNIAASLIVMAQLFWHNGLKAQTTTGITNGQATAAGQLIRYEVKPEHQEAFRKAVSDYVFHSLEQDHNLLSEAYYEQEDPAVLWIIERWDHKAALEKNSLGPEFKAITSLSAQALVSPATIFYVKDLEPLSREQWRTRAGTNDKPLIIMLFVDARAGTEDQFRAVYHTAM